MAERKIIWTQTAVRQRKEILTYWTKRNGNTNYSLKIIRQTKERLASVIEYPFSGKQTNHLSTLEAAMGNFSIYYKVTEEHIFITAFWDNRQDPDKLLDLLTINI